MALNVTNASASIGTTEYFLFSASTAATYQTTDCICQLFLDLSALAAGDEYLLKLYEKVDTTNAVVVYQARFLGAQGEPGWCSPSFFLANGYEFSLDKIAGTDRTIEWSLRTVT